MSSKTTDSRQGAQLLPSAAHQYVQKYDWSRRSRHCRSLSAVHHPLLTLAIIYQWGALIGPLSTSRVTPLQARRSTWKARSAVRVQERCGARFPLVPMGAFDGAWYAVRSHQCACPYVLNWPPTSPRQYSSTEDNPNEAEWLSEGVQVGSVGSGIGIVGLWTGAKHLIDDPIGGQPFGSPSTTDWLMCYTGAWWQWRVA